jgi:hypothetical protein
MRKEYRVVTEDALVWAENETEAKRYAREEFFGRSHAEETGNEEEADSK